MAYQDTYTAAYPGATDTPVLTTGTAKTTWAAGDAQAAWSAGQATAG